jgi:hypothetical protein
MSFTPGKGPGNGGMTIGGPLWMGEELDDVVVVVEAETTPTTGPGKPLNCVPVTLRNRDRFPLKVVRPRFSAC